MSEILADLVESKKNAFAVSISEKDIKQGAALGELFETHLKSSGLSPADQDAIHDALSREDVDRTDAQRNLIKDRLKFLNEHLPQAESFLSWLDSTGLKKDVAKSLPVPESHFDNFVRGMALRNPANLERLTNEVIALQGGAQNTEKLDAYRDARARLVEDAKRFKIEEKRIIGIAKLPTPAMRDAAIEALFAGSKMTESVKRTGFLGGFVGTFVGDSIEQDVNVVQRIKDRMNAYVTAQDDAKNALNTLRGTFGEVHDEDPYFAAQLEKIANRPPRGREETLESSRSEAGPEQLASKLEAHIKSKHGDTKWNTLSAALKLPANASKTETDWMAYDLGGGVTLGNEYENMVTSSEQGLARKTFTSSLIEMLVRAFFGREARNARGSVIDALKTP